MTVEQIEIRRILTQMLADAGINRETIKDLVREVIEEKIERAMPVVSSQMNLDETIRRKWDRYVESELDQAARSAIRAKVNDSFSRISVTVNLGGRQYTTSM